MKYQDILEEFQPKFNQVGWSIEYGFNEDENLHIFYIYPKNQPRNTGSTHIVSIFNQETIDLFDKELQNIII